jgi:hypothetical protein
MGRVADRSVTGRTRWLMAPLRGRPEAVRTAAPRRARDRLCLPTAAARVGWPMGPTSSPMDLTKSPLAQAPRSPRDSAAHLPRVVRCRLTTRLPGVPQIRRARAVRTALAEAENCDGSSRSAAYLTGSGFESPTRTHRRGGAPAHRVRCRARRVEGADRSWLCPHRVRAASPAQCAVRPRCAEPHAWPRRPAC